ncbi:MAG: iron-containing alcohol dehydrogenase [Chloroflexi bacterium]|nr:iron-containing alcohol dehydrogenase [Chloroflexota bacterium]
MFEFATANRIIFGRGVLSRLRDVLPDGKALVVTGRSTDRARPLLNLLDEYSVVNVRGEPTTASVQAAVEQAKADGCHFVVGIGGGSVIDAGKAIAALLTNDGDPLDYLEVIGRGQKLQHQPAFYIAIPTTAGTGAEVTKNAVLKSAEHNVKVSLRDAAMIPDVALVNVELTVSMPPEITAMTGMDALTQNIEPYVSNKANPLTDALAREGIIRAARSLRRAYEQGADMDAREDMALASLLGGLALANAKLGAVHGFAGPLGGLYDAPHGAICAILLPRATDVNITALTDRDPSGDALRRYHDVAEFITGQRDLTGLVEWLLALSQDLQIPPLSTYGVSGDDFPAIIEQSARSSSMQGNPVTLTDAEMQAILERAL